MRMALMIQNSRHQSGVALTSLITLLTSYNLQDLNGLPGPSAPTTLPPSKPAPPASRPHTRAQARLIKTGLHSHRNRLPEGPGSIIPEPSAAAPTTSAAASTSCSTSGSPSATECPRQRVEQFCTEPNGFGLYRKYTTPPSSIPDAEGVNTTILPAEAHRPTPRPVRSVSDIISPLPNISTFYYLHHHWTHCGGLITRESRDSFQRDILQQPDFVFEDVRFEDFGILDKELADSARTRNPLCSDSEGWKNTNLNLQIPPLRQTKAAQAKNPDGPPPIFVSIPGLRSLKLTDVIVQGFTKNSKSFHYTTFEQLWKAPGSTQARPIKTSGEMYCSPAMIELHLEVQNLKIKDADCTLPRCVAGVMFASDGLQFGHFANVKGWPIFLYFGNESKYERCKPFTNACYHVAHIPSLSDEVREEIAKLHGGKAPSEALMTHLRRELMHEVWKHLLDDDFIDAWHNGIVIDCADGVKRRVFPRILTYSADYPEKVLLATIRNGGKCLCPRCTMLTTSVHQMGQLSDMRLRTRKRRIDNKKRRAIISSARKIIFKLGLSIQYKGVEKLLAEESYVPTINAFSSKLGDTSFNIFAALVVDQLHEIELGVFKSLFQHLVRILHSCGKPLAVIEFDRRFRKTPTYASTIRKFDSSVSNMSRLAARDFEDILQCCAPAFKGLLPEECDEQAQTLLYLFAQWHGLAKLRLHTEATLKLLKAVTTRFGDAMREFADLTKDLDIRETPKEYERRKRAAVTRSRSKKTKISTSTSAKAKAKEKEGGGRRKCTLNLSTYKFHAMGDYVRCIERFGTCDSYSTQINELHNRSIKLQYLLTNKRNATSQMTEIGDIRRVLSEMMDELIDRRERSSAPRNNNKEPEPEGVSSLLSGLGYSIGQAERTGDRIPSVIRWIRQHGDDDATKFFLPQLKQHILLRLLGSHDHPDYNDNELDKLYIYKGEMYSHKTLQLNYTAYDVVRQRDILNPRTTMRFIMLPREQQKSNGTNHPFLYAKILGIYHAEFVYKNASPRRMDFVHVRWLYYDDDQPGGLDTCRLDRLSYGECRSDDDEDRNQEVLDAFDFVDPNDIIRATHLIPDFDSDMSSELLNGPSMALDDKEEGDWNYYYVNRFVDRDMLMRYIGGGVGHCWRAEEPAHELDASTEILETGAPDESEGVLDAPADEPEDGDLVELTNNLEIEAGHDAEQEEETEDEEDETLDNDEEDEPTFESDLEEGEGNDVDEEWDDLFGF
ncbi:hypothetical protein FRC12_009250 [Ceratobasidium sp. 428]|nr:hypothetical protein FRC12_009250 [Ceratobasidium sp. 428]